MHIPELAVLLHERIHSLEVLLLERLLGQIGELTNVGERCPRHILKTGQLLPGPLQFHLVRFLEVSSDLFIYRDLAGEYDIGNVLVLFLAYHLFHGTKVFELPARIQAHHPGLAYYRPQAVNLRLDVLLQSPCEAILQESVGQFRLSQGLLVLLELQQISALLHLLIDLLRFQADIHSLFELRLYVAHHFTGAFAEILLLLHGYPFQKLRGGLPGLLILQLSQAELNVLHHPLKTPGIAAQFLQHPQSLLGLGHYVICALPEKFLPRPLDGPLRLRNMKLGFIVVLSGKGIPTPAHQFPAPGDIDALRLAFLHQLFDVLDPLFQFFRASD